MELNEKHREIVYCIEDIVCDIIGVCRKDIMDKNKATAPTVARNITWYILHFEYGYSANTIAKIYNRSTRNIFKQIADIKYKIENCKFYANMHDKAMGLLKNSPIAKPII